MQKLGETIARMKSITRERMDGVLDKFGTMAQSQHVLVQDTDEYVKAVLRKALGDDKANLLSMDALPELLEAPQMAKKLESARQLAKDNPTAVANIVRDWVNGEAAA